MRDRDADSRWVKRLQAVGRAIEEVELSAEGEDRAGVELDSILCKLQQDNRTSVLLVVKAVKGDDALVGFVGATTLSEAFLALYKKLRAGAVKWREDRPWGER